MKMTKNTVERKIPIATKAGTEAEGAESNITGALLGSTERSTKKSLVFLYSSSHV